MKKVSYLGGLFLTPLENTTIRMKSGLDTLVTFPANSSKGDNFCDFLFASKQVGDHIVEQGSTLGFESCDRQSSTHECIALHCTEPFMSPLHHLEMT